MLKNTFTNRAAEEGGFTIIEVMVAVFLLLLGVLGSVTMIDTANGITANNKSREGALSLSREVVEVARQTDYDTLTPAGSAAALQGNTGLADADSATAGWQVIRRGVTYTLTVDSCLYDGPKDGGRSTADTAAYCAGSTDQVAAASATCKATSPVLPCVDPNPDDFRKMAVTSTWTIGSKATSSTQTALIVNPSGGRGPRITNVTATPVLVSNTFGPSTSGTTVTYTVTTSSTAGSVSWSSSDGTSKGLATAAGSNTWQFVYDLGTAGATGSVRDGTYTISIQAFSAAGVPGDLNAQTLVVNRLAPKDVSAFNGGRNNRAGDIVDFVWTRNQETDIVGYRVYRVNGLADWVIPDTQDTLVCGTVADPLNSNNCFDPSPPAVGAVTYYVKAVDKTTAGALRESPGSVSSQFTTALTASIAPIWPVTEAFTPSLPGGVPTITWSDPATPSAGRTIIFYRIYRDPASATPTYAERYDNNGSTAQSYKDQKFGATTAHTYAITAVDDTYEESQPFTPFTPTP